MTVRDCTPDPQVLGVLSECLTACGPPDPTGEWPGQFLSNRTVAYSCGILARQGEPVTHDHDPDELARCRRLTAEAAGIMSGVLIRCGDEGDHELTPSS
jgi:hypothetical protein